MYILSWKLTGLFDYLVINNFVYEPRGGGCDSHDIHVSISKKTLVKLKIDESIIYSLGKGQSRMKIEIKT